MALSRKERLSGVYSPYPVADLDLAKPIRRWNRNYILALKMMELEQRFPKPLERVLALLDWMRNEFIFGGPAALLASVYFGPNSSPKRRVFKGKNSSNREEAIAGVRNAAWDLTQLSEFIRRVNDDGPNGNIRYLFASLDKNLRLMAKLLFECGGNATSGLEMRKALSRWWPQSAAACIADAMFDHIQRIQSPEWKAKTSSDTDYINELIRKGEQHIRQM